MFTMLKEALAPEGAPVQGSVPDVRCPTCNKMEWRSEALVVADHGARIDIREEPSGGENAGWTCGGCGFALQDGLPLASALTQLQHIHFE